MTDSFTTEIIEEWQDFHTLQGEWNRLLRESRADIIFLTWEWISCWVSVNRQFIRPFVIVVRDRYGVLVGLAPFYHSNYRLLGTVPYRILRIMADQASGAECLDWIARKDLELVVCCEVASTLAKVSGQWDCIWMPYLAEWTGACQRIMAACRQERFECHSRPAEFGFMALPDDYETFFKSLSQNRRSQLRRQLNTVLLNDQAVVDRCRRPEEVTSYLEALFDLNARRWQAIGQRGTFQRKPEEELFYRKFLPLALQRDWLRLYGLVVSGEFKAVQVGYVYNNVFFQLQEGYDPDFKVGVGNILRLKAIEDCISSGVCGYDFLGEMTEHKRRWNAEKRLGMDLFIGNTKLKNRLLFGQGVWPTGRYLRPSNALHSRHAIHRSQSGDGR